MDSLALGGSYRFLDLGPAVGGNIEYLSRCALSVQVADLWPSIAGGEPRSWEKALQSLEPETEGPGFHAVLAWDLLNYLPRPRVRELADRLAAVTRPGGRVFAFVYYSREMPAEPVRFRIADRETLTYARPAALRPAPRYPQGAVEQAFAGFAMEKGYLLKTGLHEYLLARKPPPPPEPAPEPSADEATP
ncbi:MAG TPA: class I SAM-dependent methyltransferase [Thermoanaerobaculia bacterium]|nr:class I SAM-dependent methyltransferase [Thermoanaerobaculia bacterium]